MKRLAKLPLCTTFAITLALASFALGCGSQTASDQASEQEAAVEQAPEQQEAADEQSDASLADGSYSIEVDTDSSMFRADSCVLTVADSTYSATLVLPGEGFSRLYFGSAEDAASASDDAIYDYYLNDEGKYTFDLPVEVLDEELEIAAFGQRRDTWYPHTIIFHAPEADASADAS